MPTHADKILQHLELYGDTKQKELGNILKIKKSQLSLIIKRLVEQNKIVKLRQARAHGYYNLIRLVKDQQFNSETKLELERKYKSLQILLKQKDNRIKELEDLIAGQTDAITNFTKKDRWKERFSKKELRELNDELTRRNKL